MSSDSTELYYAEMESARNAAEDAYFKARPQLRQTLAEQALFRAGFERAFQYLWSRLQAALHERDTAADVAFTALISSAPETRPALSPPPVTTWKVGSDGACEHCGLSYLLHIVEDEYGRKDVCQSTANRSPEHG